MKFSKTHRIYLTIFLVISLLLVAAKYAVPHFAKKPIEQALKENFGSQVTIEKLSFNPLRLIFQLTNIEINKNLSFKKLKINFDFPNFFSKKITISQLSIDGINGEFVKKDDKILITGITQKKQANSDSNSNWSYLIKDLEILNSDLLFNQTHKIKVKEAKISNLNWPKFEQNSINLKASLNLDEGNIFLSGKLSKKSSNINFQLENLDLNLLNSLVDNKNLSFGRIAGNLSSKGFVKLELNLAKIESDLSLQNFVLYSKDPQLVDYFIEKLDLESLKIVNDTDSLRIDLANLDIANLLLAPSLEKIKNNKISETSNIKISDVKVSHNKKDKSQKILIDFTHGGYFAINQYMAEVGKISDIEARNINLTEFSNSFESILNYHIESGKIALDVKTITKEGKVDGTSHVKFRQLNLDNKNQFGNEIESQSFIPLKSAISMIEDDNGNLELEFEISGNANDPNFSILWMLSKEAGSSAISKVISIVANKAAIEFAPLLVSSIPVSPNNLLFFANGAYKFATRTRFSDIEFKPKKDEIKESSELTLNNVATVLKKNKKATLRICPIASINEFDDKEIDNQKILSLANDRILSIRKNLEKKLSINNLENIIFCRPTVSDNKDNIAKATISI